GREAENEAWNVVARVPALVALTAVVHADRVQEITPFEGLRDVSPDRVRDRLPSIEAGVARALRGNAVGNDPVRIDMEVVVVRLASLVGDGAAADVVAV